MRDSKRNKHYKRCQEIIDNLHDRVAKGEFISEATCKRIYGEDDYQALLHELRLMNADVDYAAMTSAMEWMHSSQYFLNKMRAEKNARTMHWVSVGSAIVSFVSAVISVISLYHTHAEPRQNERPDAEGGAIKCHEDIEEAVVVTADTVYDVVDSEVEHSKREQGAYGGKGITNDGEHIRKTFCKYR